MPWLQEAFPRRLRDSSVDASLRPPQIQSFFAYSRLETVGRRSNNESMGFLDYTTLTVYLSGTLLLGLAFARRVKTSDDMFAAGGQAPWWASGLSAFMTMFSANTFVVWGGIAYRLGMVAVVINLMYGVAALLVGYFVAGRWKQLGVRTPAEFIRLRFGAATLHYYTWSMLVVKVVGTAGALYALARILCPLMPLEAGNPLRDEVTGNLSLHLAICLLGGIVVVYTMIGGLWAVLMTDVLQFMILNMAILFVIPLALRETGGLANVVRNAPSGFLRPTSEEYSWFFLAGWCAIHFFMIGAEWAFVQRFLCVPTDRDARRSTYLFGLLYLVSPMLWLLPPLLFRLIDASVEPEQAYILACQRVLPAGMVGLMVAAMFSATASMVSSQLNVFSGVMTNDVYGPWVGERASQTSLVRAGRVFTVLIGGLLVGIALLIPSLGGAEKVVVGITEMMVTALLAPTLWGLFSRRIHPTAVWTTGLVGLGVGIFVRVVLAGPLAQGTGLAPIANWVGQNSRLVNTFTGVVLPVAMLSVMEVLTRSPAAGALRVEAHVRAWAESSRVAGTALQAPSRTSPASPWPALAVGGSLICAATLLFVLSFVTDREQVLMRGFAAGLLGLGTTIVTFIAVVRRSATEDLNRTWGSTP